MMAFIVTTTSSSPTTAKDDCIQKMACSDISGTALTPKELSEERTLNKFVQKLEQGFTFASLMLHLNSNFSTTVNFRIDFIFLVKVTVLLFPI